MTWMQRNRERLLRWTASGLLTALMVGVGIDLDTRFRPFFEAGGVPRSFLVSAAFAVGAALLGAVLLWKPGWLSWALRVRARLPWALLWAVGLAVSAAVCWLFLYTKWSGVLNGPYFRTLTYGFALVVMAWLAAGKASSLFTWKGWLSAGVALGIVFAALSAAQEVVAYPFRLSWSEGNRLWDYSLMYGREIYNYPAHLRIPAYIDRGRQSLWGLPFILPSVSILGVRLWSALVYSVPYILLGWFAFHAGRARGWTLLFLGLWTYLFLNQGPIYSPLVLAAILVAAAWRAPLVAAVLLVGLAGYYARVSRYTWLFAPAMWAAMAAFISTGIPGVTTALRRWVRAGVLGAAGVFGGYLLPELLAWVRSLSRGVSTGGGGGVVSIEGITSTLERQPLLWNRLWPNPTYEPGIVLGLLMAAGPLVLLLVLFARRQGWRLDVWQKLAIAGVLLAFLGVGLVISVKIGGGSNLHNLDMLLIGLLFWAALAWEAGLGDWLLAQRDRPWWAAALTLAVVLYPASQGMLKAHPMDLPSQERAAEALTVVQQKVSHFAQQGEVLFIDQRQLLTFNLVEQVPLVPEYEKKLLMDEAMAENADYFEAFFEDLAQQRFSLILSEPLWVNYQGDTYQFGNENDAWVKWVSVPVLCYYEPVETFMDVGVQLLTPKPNPEPGPECPRP